MRNKSERRCTDCGSWMEKELAPWASGVVAFYKCNECHATCNIDGSDFVSGEEKLTDSMLEVDHERIEKRVGSIIEEFEETVQNESKLHLK